MIFKPDADLGMPATGSSSGLDRRRLIAGSAAGLAATLAGPAFAQLRGTQTEGQIRPIPIAISDFIAEDPRLSADIPMVITNNLANSGLFQIIERGAHIERVRDVLATPRSPDWRAIGAEALVIGALKMQPDGRVRADFALWDVTLGRRLAGQYFTTPAQNWRRIGHIISDVVYEKLTLEKGYFDTRVVFVDETGPKDKRLKRLAMMDQDGENVRLLSQGRELVVTPRFSPNKQEITFMQYQGQQGRVVLMNIESGQREVLGDLPGTTFAPRFAPDGQRIAMSVAENGATTIIEYDLRSRRYRPLTNTERIDTGPCYSPDGRQICFESDRDGTQQLYVMGWDGSGVRRISRGEGRYATPVWSPVASKAFGDFIAFTKQLGGRFLIGVMKADGSGERILTEGFHNEGPTWAPNGRVLMFFRESPGASGGPRLYSVDITGYNERAVKTPSFASDPAWSPLLS